MNMAWDLSYSPEGWICLSSYKGETDLIRLSGLCSAVPNPDFTSLSGLECRGKVEGRRLHAGHNCPGEPWSSKDQPAQCGPGWSGLTEKNCRSWKRSDPEARDSWWSSRFCRGHPTGPAGRSPRAQRQTGEQPSEQTLLLFSVTVIPP